MKMTSHCRRDRLLFTAKHAHFFKIILDDALQNGKLGIPKRFIRKYGKSLPNPVLFKVPSGAEWKVGLTKCEGEVYLQNGWPEFAEYYSLQSGDFLVFRYDENSHFNVVIFNKTATEIDYPTSESALGLNSPVKEGGEGTSIGQRHQQSRVLGRMQSENVKCLQRASAFKSNNPSFTIHMHPSYVQRNYVLTIPAIFAKKYLIEKQGDVILYISDGRAWSAKYKYDGRTRLHRGWRAFVKDNHLEAGDVCVFELMKGKTILLQVEIFRMVENANCRLLPAGEGEAKVPKSEEN